METIKYTGKLQRYFRAPIYMIILFVAGDVLVYLQNIKAGALVSVCIIIYGSHCPLVLPYLCCEAE